MGSETGHQSEGNRREQPRDHRPEVVGTDEISIGRAVEVLRGGGLVAMPTETVYGLGADASSPEAVGRVFEVKGRPQDHPLIVHLGTTGELSQWSREVPEEAVRLGEAFWPGPLTMVLPKGPSVPLAVTGGRDTVAIRVPSHPVAQAILEAFGGGVAAPSANRFGRVSPTSAGDVVAELGPLVDLVVDAGPCPIGVESTVIEFGPPGEAFRSPAVVTILRPGGVSAEALEEVLGRPVSEMAEGPARAPGMLASHYAPRIPVLLTEPGEVDELVGELTASGDRVGLMALEGAAERGAAAIWDAGGDTETFARSLYRWLREADTGELDVLVAVPPPPHGLGAAVRDRLLRAAHGSRYPRVNDETQ